MNYQTQPAPQPFIAPPNAQNYQFKLVSQCCGTTISVIFSIILFLAMIQNFSLALRPSPTYFRVIKGFSAFASSLYMYFFIESVRNPEFLAGNPKSKRFWAPFANFIINLVSDIYMRINGHSEDLLSDILIELFVLLVCIGIYGQDDAAESCFLCFKPWIYKKIQVELVYVQGPLQIVPSHQQQQQPPSYPTVPFTYAGYNSKSIV